MVDETYQPNEITFDRDCVKWILENYHALTSGVAWPDSMPSCYTDLPGGQGISHHASFETACLVAAEVFIRVKRCGFDGYIVEERYIQCLSEEEIAKIRWLPLKVIYGRINKVIGYCASGRLPRWKDTKWRKGQTYEEWRRFRRP